MEITTMRTHFLSVMVALGLLTTGFTIIYWPHPSVFAGPPRQLPTQLTIDSGGTGSSYPHSFINFKGDTYFAVASGPGGFWKTDGTEEGTVLVKQIQLAYDTFIGRRGEGPVATTSEYLFFLAFESSPDDPLLDWGESASLSLWRSDGTEDGTIPLFELGTSSFSRVQFIVFQDMLYFTVRNETYSEELWRSDGTETGTVLVTDTSSDENRSVLDNFIIWNEMLYFSAGYDQNTSSIWVTDGTQAGTNLVINTEHSVQQLAVANNSLYFATANSGPSGWSGGSLLWQSDGTTAGTTLIESSYPAPIYTTVVSGKLLYQSEEPPYSGDVRYWLSDGTPEGTSQLEISTKRYARRRLVTDAHAYFEVSGPNGTNAVWRTDGTITGTVEFRGALRIPYYQNEVATTGEDIYFTGSDKHGYELWHSDGTITGTNLITDIVPTPLDLRFTSAYPAPILATDGGLLFGVNDGKLGKELWKSDGTPAGTSLVKDINQSFRGFGFSHVVAADNLLYFLNQPYGNSEQKYGLWKSDGTAVGTEFFHVIDFEHFERNVLDLTAVGNRLYYIQDEGLWTSDGSSEQTTILVESGVSSVIAYNSQLYFNRNGNLWRTDGTESGTVLVRQFQTDQVNDEGFVLTEKIISDFRIVNGQLFFRVGNYSDSTSVPSLWVSDGTETGTMQLFETFRPFISTLFSHRGILYFPTPNDSSYDEDELWRSDGTDAGTYSVKKFNPNSSDNARPSGFTALAGQESIQGAANDTLILFSAYAQEAGRSLWRTDGTETGTVLIKDFSGYGMPSQEITSMGGYALFIAHDDEHGAELWRTNGTAEGTVLVSDIRAGSESSAINGLFRIGAVVYFMADDGVHGRELWRSDGTEIGTALVVDLDPGQVGSNPQNLTYKDGKLYFTADNGTTGNQLYSLVVEAPTSLDIADEPTMGFESFLPFVNTVSQR